MVASAGVRASRFRQVGLRYEQPVGGPGWARHDADLLFCPRDPTIPFQPRWSCLRCALTGEGWLGERGRSALPRSSARGQAAAAQLALEYEQSPWPHTS